MIFNVNESYMPSVTEASPYELGIEGALMHVYENECNYNALMKAVGISEFRYYTETGNDLFVHEAGAFDRFIEQAKNIFKSIAAAIVKIFNKLKDVMTQFFASDKKFIEKYESTLSSKDLTGFKFKGYDFPGLEKALETRVDTSMYTKSINDQGAVYTSEFRNSTAIPDDQEEVARATTFEVFTGISKDKMSRSDFVNELRKQFIGNDKDADVTYSISDALFYIKETKKDITTANNLQKRLCKIISDFIKGIETYKKSIDKEDSDRDTMIKNINRVIKIQKSVSQDFTKLYGVVVEALKKRNRQSKAMCVKALSYEKEKKSNSDVQESVYDLFSNVVIN